MIDWTKVLISAMIATVNFAVIAGTAYIVFWKGHSGWWFLLTLMLMHGWSKGDKDE